MWPFQLIAAKGYLGSSGIAPAGPAAVVNGGHGCPLGVCPYRERRSARPGFLKRLNR
jgi:hypothetical protein